MARRLLPIMLAGLPEAEQRRDEAALLRAWIGEMHRDRPEPLLFAAWLRALVHTLFADEFGPAFEEYGLPAARRRTRAERKDALVRRHRDARHRGLRLPPDRRAEPGGRRAVRSLWDRSPPLALGCGASHASSIRSGNGCR